MPLISRVSKGQVITAEKMNTIIDALNEVRVTAVVGGQFSRGLGGTTITVPKSRGGAGGITITYPFQYYTSGTGFGLTAGTINGILPSNMATTFGLTLDTEAFVNLSCTSDGKTIQSAEITKDASPPSPITATPETAPTSFKLNMYYIDASGSVFRTLGTSSIAATTQEAIRETLTGVAFGEMPYRPWYTWIFAS